MLRETRLLHAPELDAFHEAIEVRTPFLRISTHRGRNVSSDWGVVERAAPFVHRLTRCSLTIVLVGRGRFDEGHRRSLRAGDVAVSDQTRAGTEAYAGGVSSVVCVDWDPSVLGARHASTVAIHRLDRADLARVTTAAAALAGERPEAASVEIVRVLRANGLPFVPLSVGDLSTLEPDGAQALADAISRQLSSLRSRPAIDDVVGDLGWGTRRVHRRLAASAAHYGLVWGHWRSVLHHYRLVSALRMLSAPGATTELVARLAGFRAPTALCHTFDDAGLPSPGTFVRDARKDVLDAWAEHARAA